MSAWWLRPFSQGEPEEETPQSSPSRPEPNPVPPSRTPEAPPSETRSLETRRPEKAADLPPPALPAPAVPSRSVSPPPSEPAEAAQSSEDGAAPETEGESRTRTRRRRGSRGRGKATAAVTTVAVAEEVAEVVEEEPEEEVRAPRPRRSRRFIDEESAHDFGSGMAREVLVSMAPERSSSVNDERKIALFCDLENLALGVRDSPEVKKFDINLVLERLLEKGKIIVKKSYCDWERYSDFKRPFHEAAIELIDIPQKYYSGKNSADIKMVVDAMDLCYSKEHLDTFVILSGDSDFSPLVSKLKENNKYVIGVGVKGSSSNLLIGNCDEFLYYEDIWRDQAKAPQLAGMPKKQAEVFDLMNDAILALVRESKDVLWGSMIKQTMQRKKPSFNEGYYGYSTFSELLEDAEEKNIIKLKKDQRSGSYIVTGFAGR